MERWSALSAVALVEALREVTGIVAEIKWPNDVLVNGRKLDLRERAALDIGMTDSLIRLASGMDDGAPD